MKTEFKLKKRIRLLALDIDDTLVYKAGKVSDRNLAAISAARRAGVYVTLATGRGFFGSSRVVKQLDLDTLVVNYGGAMINDARTGLPVFTTELENDYVQEIIAMADEMGLHAHLYQGDCVVCAKPHPYVNQYVSVLDLPFELDSELPNKVWHNVPKVLIITEPERVDGILPIFESHFYGRVCVSASSPGFIEFNRLGANKGTALAWIADRLGIDRSEVAAMGDNTLDLEMIEYAGVGAAVANASEIIRSAADLIVPSCTEDGVAYFIENYILNDAGSAMEV